MAKSSASNIKTLSAANRKPNPVGGTNRAKSVTFKKADGGLISNTSGDNSGAGPYDPGTDTIHPSMSHAAAHLEKHFGDAFDKGSN